MLSGVVRQWDGTKHETSALILPTLHNHHSSFVLGLVRRLVRVCYCYA